MEDTRKILADLGLHTVCQSAHCPNIGECWSEKHATVMLMGNVCTRKCTFCQIASGRVHPLDPSEPRRVAEAVSRLGLKHVVVTSVDRDDLPDGGAAHFASTILEIHRLAKGNSVEVLVPDFRGDSNAVETVLRARPEVFSHNIETVPRLYPPIRKGSRYDRSLDVLRHSKRFAPDIPTKTGIMVGLGETDDEVLEVMSDIRDANVDILAVGQYLQPSPAHEPVDRFVPPDMFEEYRKRAEGLGFGYVAAGPFVRSSYKAGEALAAIRQSAPSEKNS